jgi:hypothetical protein
MPPYLLGFLDAGQILTELGQDRGDPLRLQLRRRAQGILDLLARHEA